MFLDDGLIVETSQSSCASVSSRIKDDLIASGFVPKVEKSLWTPSQALEWLGFEVDTFRFTLAVPDRKLTKLRLSVDALLDSCSSAVHVRTVSSVIGQIIAMKQVIGSVAQLMTRSLSSDCLKARSWSDKICLSSESINQLLFWKENIRKLNVRSLFSDSSPTRIVFTDASDTGFGGFCVYYGKKMAHRQWSEYERTMSSTWRELKAVSLVLKSFNSFMKSNAIKLFTDNQNVCSIIQKGSMKSDLQSIALDIYTLCLRYSIQLEVDWIPRELNDQADFLSKLTDVDDWAIADYIFTEIDTMWGPHTVDRFSSYYNTKLSRFDSRYWNPGCETVDTFTADWSGEMNWIVPPVYLVARVLNHMRKGHSKGTLIVPKWYSASFWPLLVENGEFIEEIKEFVYLPTSKHAYIPSRIKGGLFGVQDLKFDMLAMKVDFT